MGRYYTGDIEGKFWFAVQPSDDAEHFGGVSKDIFLEDDDDQSQPIEIEFAFESKDLPDIDFGIGYCEEELGDNKEKLDSFFSDRDGYGLPDIAKHLELDEDVSQEMLKLYARLELGKKIKECVEKKGSCYFSCEI